MSSDSGNPGRDDNIEDLIEHTGSTKSRPSQKGQEKASKVEDDEPPDLPIEEEQKFFVGDKVEAIYESTGEWFRGKVIYVGYEGNRATHFDINFFDYGKIQKATPLANVRSFECEHEDSMQKKAYTNQCPVMEEAPYDNIDEHLNNITMSCKNRTPQRLTSDDGQYSQ